ncbi:MAG TPA: hypothetical protein VFM94_00865 [Solirubrobacterales bacterium]|nr:hypothetical protein [Solirubrobacterales bacterium]
MNPGTPEKARYYFAYNIGTDCAGGDQTPLSPEVEGEDVAVSDRLTGLAPVTQYSYCLVATNEFGETFGQPLAFITLPLPPSNVGLPLLEGAPAAGAALSCSDGIWENGPAGFERVWLRDGAPIAKETNRTYAVPDADVGHFLSCQVTAANGGGSSSATSVPVEVLLENETVDTRQVTGDSFAFPAPAPSPSSVPPRQRKHKCLRRKYRHRSFFDGRSKAELRCRRKASSRRTG